MKEINNMVLAFCLFFTGNLCKCQIGNVDIFSDYEPKTLTTTYYSNNSSILNYIGEVDSTKSIHIHSSNYGIDINTWRKAQLKTAFSKKLLYSNDSIRLQLVDKDVFNLTIIDKYGKVIEEGKLQVLGPFRIDMIRIKESGLTEFRYIYNYQLVKIGEWKRVNHKTQFYSLPEKIDFEQILKLDWKEFERRRKEYIKKNKLSRDYVE
jgi:hypothetical protein